MSYERIKAILTAAAEKAGLKEYEIYYKENESTEVEALKHEISAFTSGKRGGICFRTVVNGKMGYTSTEFLDDAEIEGLVARAAENALFIESDGSDEIFAGSDAYNKTTKPDFVPMDVSDMKKITLDIQNRLYTLSDYVADGSRTGAVSTGMTVHLSNSYGLNLSNRVGLNAAYTIAIVNKDGEPSDEFKVKTGDKSEDFSELAEKAVNGALDKMGAEEISSGTYNIIIDSKQMTNILSAFSSVFYAKNAQMGLSLLAGKENTVIASECITLIDDPFREGCPMQTHFDAEGVATFTKNVIDKGTLKTLLYNLSTARKAGVKSTANAAKGGYSSSVETAPYSFYIQKGDKTRDELFNLAQNGVYITDMKGFHAGANSVTGDFSIESGGFIIENGKKGKPIKSFTLAGNFFDLLKKIEAVSDTVSHEIPDGYTLFGAPDVYVPGMSIAGK